MLRKYIFKKIRHLLKHGSLANRYEISQIDISANLRQDGNIEDLMKLLMLVLRKSTNTSRFC